MVWHAIDKRSIASDLLSRFFAVLLRRLNPEREASSFAKKGYFVRVEGTKTF